MDKEYKATEWPDRIYVEDDNHSKYKELESKAEDDNVPFRSMKEIFMFSLILGYLGNKTKKITKRKELIFEKYLDSKIDKPLIQSLYLIKEDNDSCIIDKKGATLMAEEYANAGFSDLYEKVVKGYDMVISLTEFLLENYINLNQETPA